jgi:hypothetical protein
MWSKMIWMRLNACQIFEPCWCTNIQVFQAIIYWSKGIHACYKERGCIFYLCASITNARSQQHEIPSQYKD